MQGHGRTLDKSGHLLSQAREKLVVLIAATELLASLLREHARQLAHLRSPHGNASELYS